MKAALFVVAWIGLAALAADLPDRSVTPGATNASVQPGNVQKNICVSGWTATVRPPASFTNRLKRDQMAGTYARQCGGPADCEEDHLIPLELGGAPRDPANLWPQRWTGKHGAHAKDHCENAARKAVCAGTLSLRTAQRGISTDWIAFCSKLTKDAQQ